MVKSNENISIDIMQEKLLDFSSPLVEGLKKPKEKAVNDLLKGILTAKSSIVSTIALNLNEDIEVDNTSKRLSRQLRDKNMYEKLQESFLKQQSQIIDNDTLIVIDESDIIKTRAKKMQGLTKVRDGSTGQHTELGYYLINLMAVNMKSKEQLLLTPLSSELYSNSIESDTISNKVYDMIVDLAIFTGSKGILTLDRGFDDRILLDSLLCDNFSFIIRSCGTRNLILSEDGEEEHFNDVAKTVDLKYTTPFEQGKGNKRIKGIIKYGVKQVWLRMDPYPIKKNRTQRKVWLVVGEFIPEGQDKGGFIYYFCNFPNHQLSMEQLGEKCILDYKLRWKIEEVHRHIKQSYGLEKMQLSDYNSLRFLNLLVWIAVSFVYSLKPMIYIFTDICRNIMIKRKKDKSRLNIIFVFYRISEAISYCLRKLSLIKSFRSKKRKPKHRAYNPYQLTFDLV